MDALALQELGSEGTKVRHGFLEHHVQPDGRTAQESPRIREMRSACVTDDTHLVLSVEKKGCWQSTC